MANNVTEIYSKLSLYDLFMNMNRTTTNVLHDLKVCVEVLEKRQRRLKTALVATFLILLGCTAGFIWAIHDIKIQPVTIQLEDKIVDLDSLPLPPLEELKTEDLK